MSTSASTSTSPAKKGKAPATTVSKNVKFSSVLRDGKPKASTSASAVIDDNEDDMENGEADDDEAAGAWQTRQPSEATDAVEQDNAEDNDDDDAVMIDSQSLLPPSSTTAGDANGAEPSQQGLLAFPALSAKEAQGKVETQTRKIAIPPHRMTPLKRDWPKIYSPLVDDCGLMVRMNVAKKSVEMKTSKHTPAPSSTILQRAVDFVTAYGLGFSAEDAVALLRMEDLFVETFEIRDVKSLSGDHLSRAIGRIAGKDGKTRFTIENASKTRIVLADQKIHILGTFNSIKIARDAVCNLILGAPNGKVSANLNKVAARQRGRF